MAKKKSPAPPDPQNKTKAPSAKKSTENAKRLMAGLQMIKSSEKDADDQPTPKKSIALSPKTEDNQDVHETDCVNMPGEREAEEQSTRVDGQHDAGTPQAETEGEGGMQGDERRTPQPDQNTDGENAGDNRFSSGVAEPPVALPLACARPGESRKDCWERIRKEGRAAGMSRHAAYVRATEETDRLFAAVEPAEEPQSEMPPLPPGAETLDRPPVAVAPAPPKDDPRAKGDDSGVSGLSELPPSWPELPANAQLQVEIAWVTANRLRVRDGSGVNLAKALSPAPSYSALSWLETSILFPAKFADISVKATATQDDEKEFIRREKLSIEEMRSILSEMLEAKE